MRFEELLVRPDKMTKGIMQDLAVNFQATAKQTVDITIHGGDMQEMSDSTLAELAKKVERSVGHGA